MKLSDKKTIPSLSLTELSKNLNSSQILKGDLVWSYNTLPRENDNMGGANTLASFIVHFKKDSGFSFIKFHKNLNFSSAKSDITSISYASINNIDTQLIDIKKQSIEEKLKNAIIAPITVQYFKVTNKDSVLDIRFDYYLTSIDSYLQITDFTYKSQSEAIKEVR